VQPLLDNLSTNGISIGSEMSGGVRNVTLLGGSLLGGDFPSGLGHRIEPGARWRRQGPLRACAGASSAASASSAAAWQAASEIEVTRLPSACSSRVPTFRPRGSNWVRSCGPWGAPTSLGGSLTRWLRRRRRTPAGPSAAANSPHCSGWIRGRGKSVNHATGGDP
jgi:hypothetical protein